MIQLPQPPNTFTTLQIQCVACHEVFTVAEAYQTTTGRWRLPPDHHPSVQMRYEANRTHQSIRSVTRADPKINPLSFGPRQPDTYVNCPRCGADNRNWLQIIVPRKATPWKEKFPGAFNSILVAIGLALITFLMAVSVQNSIVWALFLAGAVILAAAFTAADLTRDWYSLRLDPYIRSILPTKQISREARLWQRGALIIIFLGFIIPVIFFLMAPPALRVVTRSLRETPETAVQTGQQRLAQINTNYNLTTIEEIEEAIKSIEAIKENEELGSAETEAQISKILGDLEETLVQQNLLFTGLVQKDIDQQIQNLEEFVNESKRLIDEQRTKADAAALEDITAGLHISGLWIIMVSLASLATVFLTIVSLKEYAESIDRMLPHPIFSSIADMTRVTIWEAKRSLQIDGDMSHIQWIEAARNGTGGIDLIGLHRAAPELDANGGPLSPTVRAQRYVIQTDMWGRILNTIVRDVRVPHTLVHTVPSTTETTAQTSSPSPDEQTRTSGDDLAQSFFPISPAPKPPAQPLMATVAVPQSTKTHATHTAVHSIFPRAEPIPPTTSPAARRAYLCEEFAQLMSQILAEDAALAQDELGKLYAAVGLDYGRFPGTLLEKCQDLVKFYQRHQRLAELLDICITLHPEILWGDIFELLDE